MNDDFSEGLTPGEGGGHENIHCTLVPVPFGMVGDRLGDRNGDVDRRSGSESESESASERDPRGSHPHRDIHRGARLAAFYFDGNPSAIFRFRLYVIDADPDCSSRGSDGVLLRLYTLGPDVEARLRSEGIADDPDSWVEVLGGILSRNDDGEEGENNPLCDDDRRRRMNFRELEGCDILWTVDSDPSRHAYVFPPPSSESGYDGDGSSGNNANANASFEAGLHAVMVCGESGTIVQSQMGPPGSQILVKDELSLWDDELWINDRGYDPLTMDFVYGNRRGVPYKLKRVCTYAADGGRDGIIKEEEGGDMPSFSRFRTVTDPLLAWTLGPRYRSDSKYRSEMEGMGGPTARMSRGSGDSPPRGPSAVVTSTTVKRKMDDKGDTAER